MREEEKKQLHLRKVELRRLRPETATTEIHPQDFSNHLDANVSTCLIAQRRAQLTAVRGLVDLIVLVAGLIASFFPTELESTYSSLRAQRPSGTMSHWPTDYTADIQPVQCHSHNDYWRPVPLKSAISAGCTGVEADVWLFPDQAADQAPDELYVGHSRSSLTPQRTFRSLYVDPLVEILEKQNPNTTLHPTLDNPRNGIFDTKPSQTLVLLIDFKTDGQKLWPIVSQQLEPLRERQYLTYFNGADVVDGPITVVVTGNAPFNKVVENAHYRDMFFDAPLELLEALAPSAQDSSSENSELGNWSRYDDAEETEYLASYASELTSSRAAASSKQAKNQGQGHSGPAPKNPAIYTPANSYYASVSFRKGVGHPIPLLTHGMKHIIRQQIAGAHKQGLKVRYWSTPSWPRGLRDYVWRVLVEEGVDYLNVDDIQAATQGKWSAPRRHRRWGLSN